MDMRKTGTYVIQFEDAVTVSELMEGDLVIVNEILCVVIESTLQLSLYRPYINVLAITEPVGSVIRRYVSPEEPIDRYSLTGHPVDAF